MPSMRVQDRALLAVTELALIESSEPSRIRAYTSAQLNNRIVRVRRFWDKYRKLARQQQRTTKTSRQQSHLQTAPNVRTERKAQVFAGALDRVETRLKQLTREERRLPRPRAKPVPRVLVVRSRNAKRFVGRSSKVGSRMKQHGRHASRGSSRNRR